MAGFDHVSMVRELPAEELLHRDVCCARSPHHCSDTGLAQSMPGGSVRCYWIWLLHPGRGQWIKRRGTIAELECSDHTEGQHVGLTAAGLAEVADGDKDLALKRLDRDRTMGVAAHCTLPRHVFSVISMSSREHGSAVDVLQCAHRFAASGCGRAYRSADRPPAVHVQPAREVGHLMSPAPTHHCDCGRRMSDSHS